MNFKRVRILVAINGDGMWSAFGYSQYEEAGVRDGVYIDDMPDPLIYHWVEADIPVPESLTIEGTVIDDAETR